MSRPKSIRRIVSITREITFDVEVIAELEWDDDGCGSPSRTGNSMTGCRGSYYAPSTIKLFTPLPTLAESVKETVDSDDDEITDALRDDF